MAAVSAKLLVHAPHLGCDNFDGQSQQRLFPEPGRGFHPKTRLLHWGFTVYLTALSAWYVYGTHIKKPIFTMQYTSDVKIFLSFSSPPSAS